MFLYIIFCFYDLILSDKTSYPIHSEWTQIEAYIV